MSYTIDIYKGELKPRNNFIDYLAFISFFPQLVAGPVERAATLLPQMEQDKVFKWETFCSGMQLALWGAFKKVWVADVVAMYVDRIYLLESPSSAMIWAATLGFTVQILADFSGYTDIARGTARMLGFELMLNFDHLFGKILLNSGDVGTSHSPRGFETIYIFPSAVHAVGKRHVLKHRMVQC